MDVQTSKLAGRRHGEIKDKETEEKNRVRKQQQQQQQQQEQNTHTQTDRLTDSGKSNIETKMGLK